MTFIDEVLGRYVRYPLTASGLKCKNDVPIEVECLMSIDVTRATTGLKITS